MFAVILFLLSCSSLLVCNVKAGDSVLEQRLELLENEFRSTLEELRNKVERLESAPSESWSCHSTQDWGGGIIEFDACDVNTMTSGDPAQGQLLIAEAGTYRLTFMGMISQCGGCSTEYAEVSIKVNNQAIATAGMYDVASDGSRGAKSTVSINVLHELQFNDLVSIELEATNSGLDSNGKGFTQWTGQRLGTS